MPTVLSISVGLSHSLICSTNQSKRTEYKALAMASLERRKEGKTEIKVTLLLSDRLTKKFKAIELKEVGFNHGWYIKRKTTFE